ncbi:MAG: recombinase family protein [Clostridia bacterium]|nr:recombinase family protein [Clostridia bacterium]
MYQYGYQAPKQRKVAVYARVSTEHEAQLSALENQKDWYKPIIAQHPEWDIVRMYTDEGITGTSAQKRPQFMKMIEDAGDGEFDLILTREVARFARNTVDTLQYTRSLKAKGVEVFFINDNIKTFDGDGELRLTIMATLAQDESRKTSIRVKCGQQTSMDNGVFYGNGNILGYDRVGKDMVINPEQAKTVRMIYDWYLDGVGIRAIKFRLEQAGRLTAMGKSNWHESNISKILQNSFYCGIITYHKEYTPDFLEQKKIRNFGEIELTKTRGTHEPIITEEEFERVQEMMAKRRKELPNTGAGKRRQIGEKQPGDVWTELLICECGHKFNRKVWHRVENDVQYGYQCYSSIRTGTVTTRLRKGLPIDDVCKTPMIAGWKLQMMVKNIFREYLHNTAEVLALAEAMLERHIDDEEPQTDNNRLIEQKHAEAEKLNKRLHSLIEMRADGEITRDIFKAKKQEIEDRLLAIQNELSQLQPQEEAIDDATHDEKIKILKFYLEQSVNPDAMDNIPEDVIRAFIVKVVVHENSFDWYLRFSPDKPPKSLCIDGKRKTTAKVSSLCSPHHRQQSLR